MSCLLQWRSNASAVRTWPSFSVNDATRVPGVRAEAAGATWHGDRAGATPGVQTTVHRAQRRPRISNQRPHALRNVDLHALQGAHEGRENLFKRRPREPPHIHGWIALIQHFAVAVQQPRIRGNIRGAHFRKGGHMHRVQPHSDGARRDPGSASAIPNRRTNCGIGSSTGAPARTTTGAFGDSPSISGAYIASYARRRQDERARILSRHVYSTLSDPLGTNR